MRRFLILLLCGLASSGVRGDEVPLPNPPLGQVLDRKGWLGEERERNLEQRLRRYRDELGVDVLVVIWDRDLPKDQTVKELTRNLGGSWSREELWAIVLKVPDSVQRPEVHYGGVVAESIDAKSLDHAVQEAISRGLKDWTDQAQLESVAMEIGEEFAYLKQRRTQELALVRERMAEITDTYHQDQTKKAFRFVLICGALSLTLAGMVLYWFQRRRGGPYEFPETKWRRRLGGTWSGGSTIAATRPTSRTP